MERSTVTRGGDVIDAPRSGGVNSRAKSPVTPASPRGVPKVLQHIGWPQEDNKIPREIFTDRDLFRAEMDAVFTGRVWVLVGDECGIRQRVDVETMSSGAI